MSLIIEPSKHTIADLIAIFSECFFNEFNTHLVKGNDEPVYLPAGKTDINIPAQPYAQVVFAHGYYASALHEIAHWCLAGEERRKKIDFGYWYSPDGRTAEQQCKFQQVEVKPQAIEWAFCVAVGVKFNVSCDNLSGDEYGQPPDHQAFHHQVLVQVKEYLHTGFPVRAIKFMNALADFYQQPLPVHVEQFQQVSNYHVYEKETDPMKTVE